MCALLYWTVCLLSFVSDRWTESSLVELKLLGGFSNVQVKLVFSLGVYPQAGLCLSAAVGLK